MHIAGALACAAGKEPEAMLLRKNGWMPNNERLPVLLYRAAFDASSANSVGRVEDLLAKSGWDPQWRNGVFAYHHYHSTSHEVLGFAAGEARIILGGEGAKEVTVRAGDIALLPCGTGHCRVSASADFLVVGAYALGQNWDLLKGAPDAAAVARMKNLPFPEKDPVGAPLSKFWK
jgi:uncharacterized protein YjlB